MSPRPATLVNFTFPTRQRSTPKHHKTKIPKHPPEPQGEGGTTIPKPPPHPQAGAHSPEQPTLKVYPSSPTTDLVERRILVTPTSSRSFDLGECRTSPLPQAQKKLQPRPSPNCSSNLKKQNLTYCRTTFSTSR